MLTIPRASLPCRPDTHNARFRLWFFFKVSNVKKGQQVVFTVLNSCKTKSLFREGMTPVACSSSRPAWERILPKFCFYYKCKFRGTR